MGQQLHLSGGQETAVRERHSSLGLLLWGFYSDNKYMWRRRKDRLCLCRQANEEVDAQTDLGLLRACSQGQMQLTQLGLDTCAEHAPLPWPPNTHSAIIKENDSACWSAGKITHLFKPVAWLLHFCFSLIHTTQEAAQLLKIMHRSWGAAECSMSL